MRAGCPSPKRERERENLNSKRRMKKFLEVTAGTYRGRESFLIGKEEWKSF